MSDVTLFYIAFTLLSTLLIYCIIITNFYSWKLLSIVVPCIVFICCLTFFTYKSILGDPIDMTMSELPDKITVVFFKVNGKDDIELWLTNNGKSQLVKITYDEGAEDALHDERGKMAEGIPVTFELKGKAEGEGSENGEGTEGGEGEEGQGLEGSGEQAGNLGWKYKVESYGEPVLPGRLPPK